MPTKPKDYDVTVHVPVMAREVVEALNPLPGKVFVDGTLGGGGHARLLMEKGGYVTGVDQDPAALERVLKVCGGDAEGRLKVCPGNFADVLPRLAAEGMKVDGVLLDLGISSDQLDDPLRGLSYQVEGPLDMRMDPGLRLTAAEIVNGWDEKDIAQLLFDYAEEPRARVLARALVAARRKAPLTTTKDLLRVVEEVYPPRFGLKRSHPAGRIFQAFRMAVNRELDVLEKVLPVAAGMLKPGGRLVVITFHSLEERVVKRVFKELAVDTLDAVGRVVTDSPYKVWKKQVPDAAELMVNARARSAHVRVLERW